MDDLRAVLSHVAFGSPEYFSLIVSYNYWQAEGACSSNLANIMNRILKRPDPFTQKGEIQMFGDMI